MASSGWKIGALMVGLGLAGAAVAQSLGGVTGAGPSVPGVGAGVGVRGGIEGPNLPTLPSAPSGPSALSGLPGLGGDGVSDLGGLNGLGGLGSTLAGVDRIVTQAPNMLDRRTQRGADLVAANPTILDTDPSGAPVVRSQVVMAQPSAKSLQTALAAGYKIARQETLEGLGLTLIVLTAPQGLSTQDAVAAIRKADPRAAFDFNHLYAPSGSALAATAQAVSAAAPPTAQQARLGLIDTGVDSAHPAFAGARIEQQAFAPGGPRPQLHGTAVASLMVGQTAAFHGAAPGAALYVADVYGAGPTGGSVEALVRGLAWLGAMRPSVIDISLVGPPNRILEAAVGALAARGLLIVAPVGNDGPAAPPMYPASYKSVIAVTGVDGRDRLLLEAGRAAHVDFAAPGADMLAAVPGGGLAPVRGTSFAAPIVAAKLALAPRGVSDLARSARKLGRGYGRGLVGTEVRNSPAPASPPR